jgi:hypothetical protein
VRPKAADLAYEIHRVSRVEVLVKGLLIAVVPVVKIEIIAANPDRLGPALGETAGQQHFGHIIGGVHHAVQGGIEKVIAHH